MREKPMSDVDTGVADEDAGPPPEIGSRVPEMTQPVAEAFSATGKHASRRTPWDNPMFMRMAIAVVVILVVLFAVKSFLPKGDTAENLTLAFTSGQQHRYRLFLTANGTRTLPPKGKTQSVSMTMGATVDMTVADADAEGANVDVTVSNFALHTGTPSLDTAPRLIKTQVRIDNDGRVVSGGLGLSAALASKMMPGWDLFSPVLPEAAMLANDSWKTSEAVAFAGEQTVQITGESTLLSYLTKDGGRVAIVKSKVDVPYSGEVSMLAMAEAFGVGIDQVGFPEGTDPKYTYDGSTSLEMTAQINVTDGFLAGSRTTGSTNYTVSVADWPSEMGEAPKGDVETSIDFSVTLKSQPLPEPDAPKEDKTDEVESPQG